MDAEFLQAVKSGNIVSVTRLLNSNSGANVNAEDKYGVSALMYAARHGNLELFKLLVTNGAKVNAYDNNFTTALMHATVCELIPILIKAGAQINATDLYGNTALICAVFRRDVAMCEILIANGADMNAAADNGTTALLEAVRYNSPEIVKLLVNKGADVNKATRDRLTTGNYTALMCAVMNRREDIVKILLENGANVNVVDTDGQTPLMMAVRAHDLKITELLVSYNADLSRTYSFGETASMYAKRRCYPDAFLEVLCKPAKVFITLDCSKN